MQLLLLGMALGMVTIAVPGPISLSLIHVSSSQGRASGVRAGLGIAGGDLILAVLGVALVSGGAALPQTGFAVLQFVSAAVLVVLGATMLAAPSAIHRHAVSVAHPFRAFFALTTLLPSALGGWLALLTAMPFAADSSQLALFAIGVVVVSFVWHPGLGAGAGEVGRWVTPSRQRVVTQIGGLATMGFGLWAVS